MRKRISYIVLVIISTAALLFFYQIRFSNKALRARNNEKNVGLLKLGMNKYQVLSIMGIPNDIQSDVNNKNTKVYYYEPTFGSSDGIYIYLEEDVRVVYIKKNE